MTVGHRALLHGCTVGNRVLVGMGAIIMDAVVVEDDVMIAAGALVTPGKRLRSGYLYAGSPAREVRALTEDEIKFLPYSAAGYTSLKQRYLDGNGLIERHLLLTQVGNHRLCIGVLTKPQIKTLGCLLNEHP